MRAKNPICPRCNIRKKAPGRAYCDECFREINREKWRQRLARIKKKRTELWETLQKDAAACRDILAKTKESKR